MSAAPGGIKPHIHDRPRGPRVALVDGVSVRIDLQRTVKVRALFNWTFAIVLNHAAPEDGLSLIVGGFQFEPRVVGIDGAAGKEVSNFLVRTTTSTRTVSPRLNAGCTRFNGAVTGAALAGLLRLE